MSLRDLDHAKYLDRNAGLRQEAIRRRALWATVVLNAMNDASREIRKMREDGRLEKASFERRVFVAWARSKDGREVLTNAGIDPTARAVEKMAEAVWSGKAISTIEKGRLDVQERQN